jgi:aspartyl protease
MRKTLAVLVLLIALPAAASKKPVEIPFTISPEGFVMVPATLGGTLSAHVIFDTGAGMDVLAPSVVEKLHGKPAGKFTAFRMWGDRLDVPLFTVSEISVGSMVKTDALVGAWDMLDQLHLEGIVSVNDFRQQPFTLDFVNKVMVFETAKSMGQRRRTGKTSPLKFDELRGITLDVFSDFLIGNQTGQCEIDTGSQNATINTTFMAPLGIDKDGKNVQKREQKNSAGVTTVRYKTTLPKIALAAVPEIAIANAPARFSDIIYDCVIGLDFWLGKVVTIDIAGRQLIVADASRLKKL